VGPASQNHLLQLSAAATPSSAPVKNESAFGPSVREGGYSGVQKSAGVQISQDSVVSLGNTSAKVGGYESLADRVKKPNSEDKQAQEQEKAEQKEIQTLKRRDTEVRIHEQAHAAVGGQYAGAPSYEYETGPNGKRYAVGGEVSIDVSVEKDPEDTISKMQIVRAAALAPAEPSSQDYKVAAEATQKEQTARAELAKRTVQGDEQEQEQPSAPNRQAIKALQEYTFSSSPATTPFTAEA
jgi:hypothetical protein